jgi:hypothetical protein
MPITVTLRALLEAQPALVRLSNEKLPVKLAYRVARLMKVVQVELDDFHKQRIVLVKQYGATRPTTEEERAIHGTEITEVTPDRMVEFRQDVDDLADEKVTLEREPLKLEDNFPAITPADLIALGPLVADEEDV